MAEKQSAIKQGADKAHKEDLQVQASKMEEIASTPPNEPSKSGEFEEVKIPSAEIQI